jgi:serine/threonine-protein kinase
VRRRTPDRADELIQRIEAEPNLRDMVQRPVLLEMITQTLDAIEDASALNLATLYETYTEKLLKQRISPDVPPISPNERRFFLEELAWEMQRKRTSSVIFSEFPERVTKHFGLASETPEKIAFFDRDIRTQSYLIRNRRGEYRFAHKSMREYFIARKLARLILDHEIATALDCPLTNAIVTFLHYLVVRSYTYDQRMRDDMMYVPAATFVLGWEDQANLAFATVQLPFLIDRYPVTNYAYCEFLNAQAHDFTECLDLTIALIRRENGRFVVHPGYENHPVTGVTWNGARAFAMHVGKRLPTQQEWELAARGVDGRRFPWGEKFGIERCNTRNSGMGMTTPVGQYGKAGMSPFGCEDMAGNVWEWTETMWDDRAVIRGGSFLDEPMRVVCAFRGRDLPHNCSSNIGFRCAKSALESVKTHTEAS